MDNLSLYFMKQPDYHEWLQTLWKMKVGVSCQINSMCVHRLILTYEYRV